MKYSEWLKENCSDERFKKCLDGLIPECQKKDECLTKAKEVIQSK